MGTLERLQAQPVLATVQRLERRIAARFPDRGLRQVAIELASLIEEIASSRGTVLGRLRMARVFSRVMSTIVLVGTAVLLVITLRDAIDADPASGVDWAPLVESTINDLVFAGLALFFLVGLPERLLRSRLLVLLHRLRSSAHIVDMHQLTKDPERLRPGFQMTPASVDPDLTRDEMEYYLDYCSELVSLVAKAAALCAEESQDSVVLDTVSRIEELTIGLSGEIWQKISLLPD